MTILTDEERPGYAFTIYLAIDNKNDSDEEMLQCALAMSMVTTRLVDFEETLRLSELVGRFYS
jgi:hypothetical protein